MSRYRFFFWLDAKKDIELLLCEAIDDLKKHRQFAATIRDSLHLLLTLRLGDTSVFESLFPRLVKQLADAYTNHELVTLRRELDELRNQVAVGAVVPPLTSGAGLSGLTKGSGFVPQVRKLELQNDDDDVMIVKKVEGAGGSNTMKAMMELINGTGQWADKPVDE